MSVKNFLLGGVAAFALTLSACNPAEDAAPEGETSEVETTETETEEGETTEVAATETDLAENPLLQTWDTPYRNE